MKKIFSRKKLTFLWILLMIIGWLDIINTCDVFMIGIAEVEDIDFFFEHPQFFTIPVFSIVLYLFYIDLFDYIKNKINLNKTDIIIIRGLPILSVLSIYGAWSVTVYISKILLN